MWSQLGSTLECIFFMRNTRLFGGSIDGSTYNLTVPLKFLKLKYARLISKISSTICVLNNESILYLFVLVANIIVPNKLSFRYICEYCSRCITIETKAILVTNIAINIISFQL